MSYTHTLHTLFRQGVDNIETVLIKLYDIGSHSQSILCLVYYERVGAHSNLFEM